MPKIKNMDKKQFVNKWGNRIELMPNNLYLEVKIEMEEDLDTLLRQNSAKRASEISRLKGEYLGTLQGISAWNIPSELREKLMVIIKKLESNNI